MKKEEDDGQYPSIAYAIIGNRSSPDTWKLRMWESPEKRITRKQLKRVSDCLGLSLMPGKHRLSEPEFGQGFHRIALAVRDLRR